VPLTLCWLHGEEGVGSDAAHVVPVASHPDVPLLAPVRAPRVFNEPVWARAIASGLGAVADYQHRVVDFLSGAHAVLEHTCNFGEKGDRLISNSL